MTIAFILSFAALLFELTSHVSTGTFYYQGQLFVNSVLVLAGGIVIAILIFFGILRESMGFAVKIAVSLFVFCATMSLLIYAKLFLMSYNVSSPSLAFALSIVGYFFGFLGVMAIFDVLSRNMRNLMFAFCSGVLGAFIGSLIPMAALILILVSMSALDMIVTRKGVVKESKKILDNYEELVVLKLSYAGKDWAIGLGDLLSYSMLVANTFATFGSFAAISSLFLILIGSFVVSRKAEKSGQVPGLPIAIGLGLLPVILYLLFPALPR
jgi:hypothetical protein